MKDIIGTINKISVRSVGYMIASFDVNFLILITVPWLYKQKNPPASAGDAGLSPGPGRSHMPWGN